MVPEVRMTSGTNPTSSAATCAYRRHCPGGGPAGVDPQIAALGPTQLLQSLTKRCDAREHCRIVQGLPEDHPDTLRLLAWLRARRERPRRRAGKQRDERAPFHGLSNIKDHGPKHIAAKTTR